MSAPVPVLFVDRDGTLIEEPADFQIDSYAKLRFVEGVIPAMLTPFAPDESFCPERTRALARRNVASTAQLEQAERALATAHAAVQQALSELIRARADAATRARMEEPD